MSFQSIVLCLRSLKIKDFFNYHKNHSTKEDAKQQEKIMSFLNSPRARLYLIA
jgi:hypothetical protein